MVKAIARDSTGEGKEKGCGKGGGGRGYGRRGGGEERGSGGNRGREEGGGGEGGGKGEKGPSSLACPPKNVKVSGNLGGRGQGRGHRWVKPSVRTAPSKQGRNAQ